MDYHTTLTLQLLGNSVIAIVGKLKADDLNMIHQVSVCLHLLRTPDFGFIIETAPGQIHKSTPSPDTAEEVSPPRDDFPFLLAWLRLC